MKEIVERTELPSIVIDEDVCKGCGMFISECECERYKNGR